jgi:hypothetical protein
MSTYIDGVEAALASIQKNRQKDINKALWDSFLSVSRLPLLLRSPWRTVTTRPQRVRGAILRYTASRNFMTTFKPTMI